MAAHTVGGESEYIWPIIGAILLVLLFLFYFYNGCQNEKFQDITFTVYSSRTYLDTLFTRVIGYSSYQDGLGATVIQGFYAQG